DSQLLGRQCPEPVLSHVRPRVRPAGGKLHQPHQPVCRLHRVRRGACDLLILPRRICRVLPAPSPSSPARPAAIPPPRAPGQGSVRTTPRSAPRAPPDPGRPCPLSCAPSSSRQLLSRPLARLRCQPRPPGAPRAAADARPPPPPPSASSPIEIAPLTPDRT